MSRRFDDARDQSSPTGVLIHALGNRWRGDDAVGPWVLDRLAPDLKALPFNHCRAVEGVNDAMGIVATWKKTDLTVVIDAAVTGSPPGTIHCTQAGDDLLPRDFGRCSSHGSGLAEAIQLGKVLDRLPARLVVYAIEADSFEPGMPLSDSVRNAGERLHKIVIDMLSGYFSEVNSHA